DRPRGGPAALVRRRGERGKGGERNVNVQAARGGGQVGKGDNVKVNRTSKLSVASIQGRAGKPVLVQREIKASDLRANQMIAVIYSSPVKGEEVLLAAVVQAGEK